MDKLVKCATCLYNKNCQFIGTHKNTIVEGCTAYKDATNMVEVVRCKNCEQFMQQYDIHNGRKLHYGICKLNSNKFHDEEVNCDHYCGYGKRKEGAEE